LGYISVMKANELRIGNWVYCNHSLMRVNKIEDTIFGIIGGGTELKIYQPIPLTEEWLLKFGFLKVAGLWSYNNGNQEFVFNEDHISVIIEGQWMSLNHIKNVHQLQNLYFALTGEELTIK